MQTYQIYLQQINTYIKENRFNGAPDELYAPIDYTMDMGGKRVRPVLALMACELFNGDLQKALPVATALEVFHNFTLVHDDIMDKAPLRRGQPTVHVKWNPDTAILAGDLMMIKAVELLSTLDAPVLKKCLPLFMKTAAQVCEGQQLDMNFEQQEQVTIADYLHMIELKTAVLLAASLKLGSYIANAPEEDAQHLYEFGKHIGIAFQLQDDILDVYGDSIEFGKQPGGDIISNKKTFLLIKALELAKGNILDELNQWIHKKQFNEEEKVAAVKAIYDKEHVRELAEEQMNFHQQKAFEHLQQVHAKEAHKAVFSGFASFLQQRAS